MPRVDKFTSIGHFRAGSSTHIKGYAMAAVYAILLFVVVIAALNVMSFGRID